MSALSTYSRITLSLLAGLCVATQASAQVSSSTNATATVVDPAVIAKTSDLDFGQIEAGSKNRKVVVNPRESSGNSRTETSNTVVSPAVITIAGASNQSYSISLPQAPVTLTRQNGDEKAVVQEFTSDIPEGLLLSGTQTVHIGATLSLENTEMPGLYSNRGGIPVIVNYN